MFPNEIRKSVSLHFIVSVLLSWLNGLFSQTQGSFCTWNKSLLFFFLAFSVYAKTQITEKKLSKYMMRNFRAT